MYILNRDVAARLTISSPLEAHKSHTLVYHVVGVDVGFENPMFACLEMDYEVSDDQSVKKLHKVREHLQIIIGNFFSDVAIGIFRFR